MNASVAIQVLPKVGSDEETIRIVDAVIDYIKSTGLNYFVGPCISSLPSIYPKAQPSDSFLKMGKQLPGSINYIMQFSTLSS